MWSQERTNRVWTVFAIALLTGAAGAGCSDPEQLESTSDELKQRAGCTGNLCIADCSIGVLPTCAGGLTPCPTFGTYCTKKDRRGACSAWATGYYYTCSNLQNDIANCGACNMIDENLDCKLDLDEQLVPLTTESSCGDGQRCDVGHCCASSESWCGDACVDLVADAANCGACNNACGDAAGEVGTCTGGSCDACGSGSANCDLAGNSCETDVTTTDNCLSCEGSCTAPAGASSVCTANGCSFTCDLGYADCNAESGDGCEAELSAATSCGGCGNDCTASPAPANALGVCTDGACAWACVDGYSDCNHDSTDGCEIEGACAL